MGRAFPHFVAAKAGLPGGRALFCGVSALALALVCIAPHPAAAQAITHGGGDGGGGINGGHGGGPAGGGGGGGGASDGPGGLGGDGGTGGGAGASGPGGMGGAGGAAGPGAATAAGGGGGGGSGGATGDGGAGGDGGSGNYIGGFTDIPLASNYLADGGLNGEDGLILLSGNGGGGGGGGGLVLSGAGAILTTHGYDIVGGNGGAVGFGRSGNAGGGGAGLVLLGGSQIIVNTGSGGSSAINGGAGGTASLASPSGDGGGGGAGLFLYAGGLLDNQTGTIAGGHGGAGAVAGGNGGAGVLSNVGIITNGADGTIAGGQAGDGDSPGTGGDGITAWGGGITNAGTVSGGVGGFGLPGGFGGAGVRFRDGQAATLTNTGTIAGGGGSVAFGGLDGQGGAGVVGAATGQITIVNSGLMAGGLSGSGAIRADAIVFSGDDNRLELRDGYSFVGNVVAGGGNNNVLALGGTADAGFDVTQIGAAAQFQDFTSLEKTGSSTWTLTGDNLGFGEEVNVLQGTLNITGQLGSAEGRIGYAGADPDATAAVVVAGAGAVWDTTGSNLFVGRAGRGTLDITGGAQVSSFRTVAGYDAGDEGAINVTGPGSTLTAYDLQVGRGGHGDMTIANGGAVISTSPWGSSIGANAGSTGTMTVTGDGSIWSGDVLGIGSGGTGTLTVAKGGKVESTGEVSMGAFGGTGTLNIGAGAGEAAVAGGIIDTPTLTFLDSGTLVFNHTDTDYVFSSDIKSAVAGTHAIDHIAGNTTLTGDSSLFAGTTTVSGGTLSIDGTLGGVTAVENGGILGGHGTLGDVTIGAGGTLAPGNSIGTIHIGALTYSAGAIHAVELSGAGNAAGTDNDLTIASGVVNIDPGAILHVTAENGTDTGETYTPGLIYTVITSTSGAATGVTGTFGTLTDDYLYLDFTDSYDSHNVYLTSDILGTTTFCLAGFTDNQCAAAGGAQSLGSGTLFNAIANLTDKDVAAAAFDALSGEIHASGQTALIDGSHFVSDAINDHIRASFAALGQQDTSPLAYAGAGGNAANSAIGGALLPTSAERFAAWGSAFGAWGYTNSDGNAAGLDSTTGGMVAGVDGYVTDTVRLGVVAAYTRSGFEAADRASSGNADTYHLGAYGGTEIGALGIRGGATYGLSHIDTTRVVTFPGFTDMLSAGYDAGLFQAFGEVSYRFDMQAAVLEPFANLAHVSLHTDGYTETGGAAALTGAGETTNTTFATLGIRASTAFELGDVEAKAHGTIGWQHAFGDTVPTATHALVGGNAFSVAGSPIVPDAAIVEAGLDFTFAPNATLGFSYNGRFGGGAYENGAKANLSVKF